MKLFHPTRRALSNWAGVGRARWVERHVRNCNRCITTLDEMTALDPRVLRRLQEALAPTNEAIERINLRVQEAHLKEETLGLVGDLLGLGWFTAEALLKEDEDDR